MIPRTGWIASVLIVAASVAAGVSIAPADSAEIPFYDPEKTRPRS